MGLVQRKAMMTKWCQLKPCFSLGCPQPSRHLHKTQVHRQTAEALGTVSLRLTVSRGLESECAGQGWEIQHA